ncbi:hypothetical protein MKW94_021010 [Papaver nudicaule]|uniref:Plant basic secretory protein (BSP) family protein n=1 Tax=Papaver nudicaule TaxID=74823 RepID=A0AA41VA24_PAPNU|nr:hypothetical protein [Papaver nudicaule]
MAHQNLIFIFLSSLVLISLASKTCAMKFVVSNEAVGTTGGTKHFKATNINWQIFGQSNEANRKNVHDGVADYINGFSGDIKTEITGIIYHELAHVWQLKANLPRSYWAQRGSGNHWGERSDITAYFLDYCESLRPGLIKDLNTKMKTAYDGHYTSWNCWENLLIKFLPATTLVPTSNDFRCNLNFSLNDFEYV